MASYDYDLFVIGGGSGGVRAARVAAALGKRVGIAEEFRFGGTCVIRGCVPKKLYVYASQFPEHFADAAGYGWTVPKAEFNWQTLVANKEREISRLEAIYKKNVQGAGGETFQSRAVLVEPHVVRLVDQDRTVTADQILIATGGRPASHPALPGHEHCIFSNEAFDLPELPKAIMIEGGGYIAVEFANIFHGLGVETTLVYRGKEILSRFDMDLRSMLHETMVKKGIRILCRSVSEHIKKRPDGRLDAHVTGGVVLTVDQVMLAIGRVPNTENLGLEQVGVEMNTAGAINVGIFSDFPPFSSASADMSIKGYDIDVAQAIADALKVKLNLVSVTGQNRIPYLTDKRVDILMSVGYSKEREQVIDFAAAYAPYYIAVIGPKALAVKGKEDLADKSIAVNRGTLEDTSLTEAAPADADIKRFDNYNAVIQAFISGQTQLMVVGNDVGAQVLARQEALKPEQKFQLLTSPSHIGLNKNEGALKKAVNDAVAKMLADGKLDESSKAWLKTPLNPDNLKD